MSRNETAETPAEKSVARAIAESAAENRIVILAWTEDRHAALARECEDTVQASPRGTVDTYEYWGTDEDGDEWRVHLVRDTSED